MLSAVPTTSGKPCLFCSIIDGVVEAAIVASSPHAIAFLDVAPLFKGHVLVVPRAHHETLVDLPTEQIGPLFAFVQEMAAAVRDGLGAQGTFVANNNVVSQSVPHLHIHVVPRTKGDGLKGFFWPRTRYADAADAADHARRIAAARPRGPALVGREV